jgi:catechol 2,3-dioxygenase-like lactoylglutathione lyase family enzyme
MAISCRALPEVYGYLLPRYSSAATHAWSCLAGAVRALRRVEADTRRDEAGAGGWNRFMLKVSDLVRTIDALRRDGAHFRNDIVTGVGGKQIMINDPSGNPVELL